MNKYEAMFIIKPDLSEEDKKNLFTQLGDIITKHHGNISNAAVWQERKKFIFPIQKYVEGVYYLIVFTLAPDAVKDIRNAYKLNENILRVMITAQE